MAKTDVNQWSETAADNLDINDISLAENVMKPPAVNNAFREMMAQLKAYFKSSLFRLRDGTDETKLLDFDISGITTGTTRTITVPDIDYTLAPPRGHIYGLTLSNNSTDATNDIDIAIGEAASDDAVPILIKLASGLTKRLDAAWAVGTGNGGWLDGASMPNGTGHAFTIRRSDTGVVDVGFSASLTPTLPTNYDQKRRIGSIIRVSGAILAFSQNDDEFLLGTVDPTLTEAAGGNPGSSAILRACQVPSGIKVEALLGVGLRDQSADGAVVLLLTSPDQTDVVAAIGASGTRFSLTTDNESGNDARAAGEFRKRTDTSRQVRFRLSGSDGDISYSFCTYGWIDTRGK
jgi:hypothetical protein